MKKPTVLSVLIEVRDLLKRDSITEVPVAKVAKQINDRFTDNGDGTISDKELKVVWVKDPTALGAGFQKALTFDEAKAACAGLSYAGHKDWRMPTLKEEQSIRDYTRHDPAWDKNVFAGKYDNWYWTSAECAWNKDAAWCVNSSYGGVSSNGKSNRSYVRPVRSSQ